MSYLARHWPDVLLLFWQHIYITAMVLLIGLLIAVPLALIITRYRLLSLPVMGVLGIIYTIPSIALFALLIPVLGLGLAPAVTALVAYCQVILVRNIVVGLQGVDPAVLEAAAGMGLSSWQIFWAIKVPLALPVALAGMRVAAVTVISIATIAAWINAGGLGVLLFQGLYQDNPPKVLIGTVLVALMAISANTGLAWAERRVRRLTEG